MCESRAVPSGKVYRQLFDAQVQLSRCLLAGRRDGRTDCLSAEDSNTHCSTTSRWRCRLSSRGQDADDDVDDVTRLPDTLEIDRPSSDIIKRLTEIKRKKHEDALKQLDSEFTELTQVCETQVRTVSLELLSSLQEVDLRLNNLKNRMEHLELVSVQEVCVLWEEVKEELKLRRSRILELNQNLTETETQRTNKIRVVLRDFCHLLEKISFLSPCDVHRLIHSKATMLNQSLLANRRSVAHLVLLLQEENLQQESLLRLHWEDCVSRWRRSRVSEVIDRFRSLCRSEEEQQLVSGQQELQELKASQQVLLDRRCDVIHQLCSLVPPSCSTALVSDWFNQLTAINQQIDALQAVVLHQLRCCYEQTWSERLAEVKRCEKTLSALELSEEEVNDVISSQLLTLIGQSQRQDEERLAALEVCWDSVARHTLHLSRCVFAVMRGMALLWETHSCRLGRREEEIQQHLDELRGSQQQHVQRKKVRLDDLLSGLRQESSEDALRASLDKTVRYLQDIKYSCSECVSAQCQLLDRLPSLSLEELLSYSSRLSSFYHLHHTYRPSPEELQVLVPAHVDPEVTAGAAETQNRPISCQNEAEPAHPSQDWLTEAESSLLELYDISSDVTFTSSGGVTYIGPMFRCPAPNLPDHLRQETHLSLFPVEVLTQTLSRMRTLLVDHLQQHFHGVLRSVVAVATDRKEVVRSEQELQLQQLNPQHIQTHIYHPRLAELQLHRRRVEAHCEEVSEVLSSCRAELQELSTSISRKNQELCVSLSKMEDGVLTADRSARLEAVSSALQDCLDHHMKHTQHLQTSFRQTVQRRLQEVRNRTSHLLNSFRLFSEGGDFAPQEVKLFQRRLKEETRQISGTEESVLTQLETFESRSLQQVNEASAHLQDKLSVLRSEVSFTEKIHRVISSTQVHIRAQAACSNQQQSSLSSMLEDLRRTMEARQVSPDQVCCLLSSLSQELSRRCQYLDFSQARLTARPKSRKQVRSAPAAGLLQPSRTGVSLLRDPAVDVIRSLSRFRIQDGSTGSEDRGGPAAGVSLVRQQSASAMRSSRTIRTDKRFQVFGPRLEPDQIPDSFSSSVNAMLWTANDVLLLVAEEFYLSEHSGRSRLLLPDTLDQWAESMQQRLLGYQEQARTFLSTSREELEKQLSALDELLRSLPAALIGEHERRQGAELQEAVGGVRQKLEETLAASEEDKRGNVRRLRTSLTDDELQTLNSSEERRQQRLQSAVCCTHLELQECVRVRGEAFVTSLASLTENLLHQLDNLPTPAETATVTTVTMETGAEPGPCTVSRTWSGIQYLSPTHSTADPTSSITMATTASITTSRCTLGHQAVIEQRDAAVKRFEQLFQAEMLRSDEDKRRQLSEAESWSEHWRQQIHTLTHTP